MCRLSRSLAWVVFLLSTWPLAAAPSRVAVGDSRRVTARVTSAALFKNGLAMVTREALLPGAGEFVLADLPVPICGSFWVDPPAGAKLASAIASSEPQHRLREAVQMIDLLRANVGKQVEVETYQGWTSGVLRKVPEAIPELPLRLSRTPDSDRARYGTWRVGEVSNVGRPGYVLIETEQGNWAVSPDQIRSVRAESLSTEYAESRPGAALTLHVTGNGGKLKVTYLTWGLTWSPSYQVTVLDAAHAKVELKATILNEVEVLDKATLRLTTGYPNLRFAGTIDPLALVGDIQDYLDSLSPRRGGSDRAYLGQQVMLANAYYERLGESPASAAEPVVGEQVEDLFFYPLEQVTLDRGQRGYYPLFEKTVPCESIYTWEVDAVTDTYGRSEERDEVEPPPVWHALKLTNDGELPWTTGPALTLRDGRALGQDLLLYTGAGRGTELKVTRAVDVQAESRETEVERERDAGRFNGRTYDRVTVKGELRLLNHKPTDLNLRLTRPKLSGELVSSNPTAEVRKLADRLQSVNPTCELEWNLALKAGDKAYLTYTYKVFVRP